MIIALGPRRRRLVGWIALRRRAARRVPDRPLHVPDDFIVFSGEPSAWAREHVHADHGEGPLTMLWVVVLLAIGAVIAGLLQIQGLWELALDFLNPAAEPLVEATVAQELTASRSQSVSLWWGSRSRAYFYGPSQGRVPQVAPLRHVLEHKFYFDEAYHTRSSPGDAARHGTAPVRRGARDRGVAARPRAAPARRLRAYARARPASSAPTPSRSRAASPSWSSSSWWCASRC